MKVHMILIWCVMPCHEADQDEEEFYFIEFDYA